MTSRTDAPTAGELLQTAFEANLPTSEVRKLMQLLPLHLVQSKLAERSTAEKVTHFATANSQSPALGQATHPTGTRSFLASRDAAAADRFENLLSSDLPAKEIRQLMRSLPAHVAQAVLTRSRQASTTVPSTMVELKDLEVSTVHDIQEPSHPTFTAAAALFKKALHFKLPEDTLRLLKASLPCELVEEELRRSGHIRPAAVAATSISDVDAQEIFALAMAADLPAPVMRSIVRVLPLHVVQTELSQSIAPPVSKL